MRSTRQIPPLATAVDRVAGIVRAWVHCYTVGLPADVAMARKETIEADLWDELQEAEQLGVAGSVGQQRMSRLFRGIPADVSWRLEQRIGNAQRRDQVRISKVELVLLVGAIALSGIGLVGGLWTIANPDPTRWQSWGPYGLVAGLALSVVGLVMAIPRPAAGLALAIAGTLVAVAAMPWAFYLFLPVPLVAWFRHARSRSTRAESASIG